MTSNSAKAPGVTAAGDDTPKPQGSRRAKAGRNALETGIALRSAYQAVVDEGIPQHLRELLGKLD